MILTQRWKKLSLNSQKLNVKINSLTVRLATTKGIKERIDKQCSSLKEKIDNVTEDVKVKKDAHLLLLAFISHRREAAIKSIEEMSTYGLRSIYEDERRLIFLKNEEKKNSAAFKMEVGIESMLNGQLMITGLKDERGGGVTESVSVNLRMAALEWLGYTGPLLLDESYKSLSNDNKIWNVARLLKEYVNTSKRQVFFASHMVHVFEGYADQVVSVSQKDGLSHVKTTK